jgi:predicted membrane-bound spermidine synthase
MNVDEAMRVRARLLWLALGLIVLGEILGLTHAVAPAHSAMSAFVNGKSPFLSAALLASAVVFMGSGAPTRLRYVVLGGGVGFMLAYRAVPDFAIVSSGWFGVVALACAAFDARKGRAERLRLLETAILPIFALATVLPFELSALLHPRPTDENVLEHTLLGFQAFHAARVVGRVASVELPVALSFVYLLERRSGRPSDVQVAFVGAGLVALCLFQPSLHAVAIAFLCWHARRFGRAVRVAAIVWGALALLDLGLAALVIAAPFAVTVRAIQAGNRRVAISAGFAYLAWVAVQQAPVALLEDRWVMRALAVVTTLPAIAFEARLARDSIRRSAIEIPQPDVLATGLGFAGLVYETVVAQRLAVDLGSAAIANVAALVLYVGGVAVGAIAARPFLVKRRVPVAALAAAASCVLPYLTKSPYIVLVPAIAHGLALRGSGVLGAAIGAVAATYVLVPAFGLEQSTLVALVAYLAVAVVAMRLPQKRELADPPSGKFERIALVATGFCVFALYALYTHLLGATVGTGVRVYGATVGALGLGLGFGVLLGRRARPANPSTGIGLALTSMAAFILWETHAWNALPGYFAQFSGSTRPFASSELVRFCCAFGMIAPPSFCAGAAVGLTARRTTVALGLLGGVVGAVVACWALVPALGSLDALTAIAGLAALVAAAAVASGANRRVLFALAAVVVGAVVRPSTLAWTQIARGSNVHFAAEGWGEAIDHAESIAGGITIVTSTPTGAHILVRDGKFAGSDAPSEAPPFASKAGRALVLGVGTGATARVLAENVEHVTVVEPAKDAVRIARADFASINDGALDRVEVQIETPRRYLRGKSGPFDVVVIEHADPWSGGADGLFDAELYALVRGVVGPRGVVAQHFPLRYVDPDDLRAILGAIHGAFPFVAVYAMGDEAIALACRTECAALRDPTVDPAGVDRLVTGVASATDDSRFLAYHAARSDDGAENLRFLRSFAPR